MGSLPSPLCRAHFLETSASSLHPTNYAVLPPPDFFRYPLHGRLSHIASRHKVTVRYESRIRRLAVPAMLIALPWGLGTSKDAEQRQLKRLSDSGLALAENPKFCVLCPVSCRLAVPLQLVHPDPAMTRSFACAVRVMMRFSKLPTSDPIAPIFFSQVLTAAKRRKTCHSWNAS